MSQASSLQLPLQSSAGSVHWIHMTAESTHELTDGAGAVNLTAAFPSPTIPFHLSRETTNRWRARRI
jgi:hypothetical protein